MFCQGDVIEYVIYSDGLYLSTMWYYISSTAMLGQLNWCERDPFHVVYEQSGTKPNLVAKILATDFGNLWA